MIYNIKYFTMKILNFENFLNESVGLLKESISQGDTYLVGDSASILTGSGKEIKNKVTVLPDLSVVGIGTTKFSELLKKYNKTHPEAKFVFLFMGANDLYHINSSILKSAKVVKEELHRIFPNAQKFIAKAGSWGWGGLSEYGKGNSAPSELFKYYEQVWRPLGFIPLQEYLKIQYDDKDNPIHPNLSAPGMKEMTREILDIIEGKKEFYTEDIRSLRDQDSIEGGEGALINYYDVLQNAIHEGLNLTKTSEYTFDPVVERAQVGLKFLGYPLPRFGVDGLFGPETELAVREYKTEYEVEGDLNSMDDYFFISLINNLKNSEFNAGAIEEILAQSYESIEAMGDEETSAYQFTGDLGGDEYLIFVQHNQGVTGATSLLNAKYGKGKIYSSTRTSGMINNIPSDMKDFGDQIREALKSGNEQRAASLFLEMWKIKYASKKEQGMKLINTPQYANIKAILEKASANTGIPFDVLVAIATIESGLNPNVGNSTYKGLFALNPSTAVKYNPAINQSTVHDPMINADAASKMLASGKEQLAQGLRRSGVISNLDFS
jgi:hypothetical protein